jgi:putative transposase
MSNDKLVSLKTPETCETFKDALSELVRKGARQILPRRLKPS